MMTPFRNWPIKQKLTAIIMLTSEITLALTLATLLTNDLLTAKQSLTDEMHALAEVLGANSTSALVFDDNDTAAATLSSAARHPHITIAAVFDRTGRLFASYQNPALLPESIMPLSSSRAQPRTHFHTDHLEIIRPIMLDGERVGWVLIQTDLSEIQDHLRRSIGLAVAVFSIAGVLAFTVASWLQQIISAPILTLAHTMKQVSEHKDYSLRSTLPKTHDEMSWLATGFNDMLATIQDRDNSLNLHKQHLEQEVANRTEELSSTLLALQKQQHFLNSMIENLPIMVFVKDSQNLRILHWNQAAEDLTGFSRDHMLSTDGRDVFAIDDMNSVLAHERTLLHNGSMVDLQDALIHTKHHGVRTLHMKKLPILDEHGQPRYLLGIAEDITEKMRAEKALRTSELRLSLTVKGAQIGIWDWDLGSNTVYFSPEWKRQLGYAEEEVSNTFQEWESRVHPDDLPRLLKAIDDYLQNRSTSYEYEHRLRHKDGTYRWILTRGALFTDPGCLSRRMVGIHIDLTEQKQVEEALRTAKEHAEAASVAKSQFVANMSHEIRTPMNGVLGMTELLLETSLTDKQRRMASTVQQSAQALLTILNDILDFSKIEAGKLQLEYMDFDIHAVFGETIELLAESARRKGLELSYFVPPTLPIVVHADPTRLRQILTNLVGNAIKFTARGAVTVTVSCLSHTDKQVSIKVSVTDTGIGMSPESQTRIFDAFSQGDGSTSRQYGGTGLGLTIVKQLVDLMDGTVGLESQPGKGSTFWFTVTVNYRQNSSTSNTFEILNNTVVLAVDDNTTNRDILREYLTIWGMHPDVVGSADEALRLLQPDYGQPRPYDLILLDICMPGMDGLALAQRIKESPLWASTPLIALSSTDCTGTGALFTESGFACALRKPLQTTLLRQCLKQVLTRATEAASIMSSTPSFSQTSRRTGSLQILLVEDNPVNRDVGLAMLNMLGYRVEVAANGRDAVDAVQRMPFALILMDCQMPVMNGFDATAAIRQWEETAHPHHHTPIIALTANAMQGDRERCRNAGMDDYLAKPFTTKQLGDILAQWLSQPESSDHSVTQATVPQTDESPIPSASPTANLVDFSAWAPIKDLAGSGYSTLLAKALTAYLADAPLLVTQMKRAVSSHNSSGLREAAHRLKSSSATLGAMTVASLCEQLEQFGRTGRTDGADQLIPRLEQDCEGVCAIFNQALIKERAA